ncbi:MAG TPA: NAD(+)--rifampin ADP-ribosyltransferase [Mucilaginibacter sp.]|jgi:rifampin ADP-ribosylating transferase|nr:NAD(+)--rifampin ADP-ribosyltransferase [Mucilaginibacter sp.]
MDFNPNNNIVKLCVRSLAVDEKGEHEEANKLSLQAWNEATNDFEKFLAAYFVARYQKNISDKLKWFETAWQLALKLNSITVNGVFPSLYSNIARCYEDLNDLDNAKKNDELSISFKDKILDEGPFYHGTKANLQLGDLLTAGYNSNYSAEIVMNHIYFTALANGAGLAAALAKGDGPERIYIVEPTGSFENDPNVTDKKFPGNLTRSYRTAAPLKIIGEVTDWAKQTPEDIQKWHEKLAKAKGEIIN